MEWAQFFGFTLTIAGLFFWNRSEANSDRREMLTLIKSIEQEMKDFHNRLTKQDAEFKAGFLVLDERIKNKGK